jgi:hypothetical protein
VAVLVKRIESANSVRLFDTERHRFRRLPLGAAIDAPALDADWEPYFAFDLDEATGAFTVALNEDGTQLLRAFRTTNVADAPTQELRLDPEPGPGA